MASTTASSAISSAAAASTTASSAAAAASSARSAVWSANGSASSLSSAARVSSMRARRSSPAGSAGRSSQIGNGLGATAASSRASSTTTSLTTASSTTGSSSDTRLVDHGRRLVERHRLIDHGRRLGDRGGRPAPLRDGLRLWVFVGRRRRAAYRSHRRPTADAAHVRSSGRTAERRRPDSEPEQEPEHLHRCLLDRCPASRQPHGRAKPAMCTSEETCPNFTSVQPCIRVRAGSVLPRRVRPAAAP